MGQQRAGSIEVICGGMFSGKTEELIRRIKRAQIARQKVQVFKPSIDTRYSVDHVSSHSAQRVQGQLVDQAKDILTLVEPDTFVVAVDEGQFFDASLVDVCQRLADEGRRVVVAGLDQDYRGEPFEPIPQLMAVAEMVSKCNAICVVCGGLASRTQRRVPEGNRVQVGANEAYEARCRNCHEPSLTVQRPHDNTPRLVIAKDEHVSHEP